MLLLLGACSGEAEPPPPGAADGDGDGYGADDCDDDDPTVHPGASELAGDAIDQDCDGRVPPDRQGFYGSETNEGFGSRVVMVGGAFHVAAPFAGTLAGRVYEGDAAMLEGGTAARLGAGLAALDDGTLLIGSPGDGTLTTLDGERLWTAAGTGAVVAARGSDWVTSTPTGAQTSAGGALTWGEPPSALAIAEDGTVVGGFARGEVALRFGGSTVSRGEPQDEAGYALAVGDADGDGDEDLVVGAPGSGSVLVLDLDDPPASLSDATSVRLGSGRFGAAIAVFEPGVLYVGAPMGGDGVAGAVYRVDALGTPVLAYEGESDGEQLGFALSAADDALFVGAPGAASDAGRARVEVP